MIDNSLDRKLEAIPSQAAKRLFGFFNASDMLGQNGCSLKKSIFGQTMGVMLATVVPRILWF